MGIQPFRENEWAQVEKMRPAGQKCTNIGCTPGCTSDAECENGEVCDGTTNLCAPAGVSRSAGVFAAQSPSQQSTKPSRCNPPLSTTQSASNSPAARIATRK